MEAKSFYMYKRLYFSIMVYYSGLFLLLYSNSYLVCHFIVLRRFQGLTENFVPFLCSITFHCGIFISSSYIILLTKSHVKNIENFRSGLSILEKKILHPHYIYIIIFIYVVNYISLKSEQVELYKILP